MPLPGTSTRAARFRQPKPKYFFPRGSPNPRAPFLPIFAHTHSPRRCVCGRTWPWAFVAPGLCSAGHLWRRASEDGGPSQPNDKPRQMTNHARSRAVPMPMSCPAAATCAGGGGDRNDDARCDDERTTRSYVEHVRVTTRITVRVVSRRRRRRRCRRRRCHRARRNHTRV